MPNRIIAKVYPSNNVYASDSVLAYGADFDIQELFQTINYASSVSLQLKPFNPAFSNTKLLNCILHDSPVYPNTEFNFKWKNESYTVMILNSVGLQRIGPHTTITLMDSIQFNFAPMHVFPDYLSKPANDILQHLADVNSTGFDSILVTGPKGVGKTTLVQNVVSHSNIPIKYTRASNLILGGLLI
jgi:hypothetical protein